MSSPAAIADAQAVLSELAGIFFQSAPAERAEAEAPSLNVEARYRAIVEQIPAVVFMAYLDEGIGEAYVSPQIEATLGFTQREWLEDPIRWYRQIHPDDKQRWSMEAAEMFFAGTPLRSAYRVMARDGRVIWFHCEVKMMRRADGRPWFIHGVGFDISELKRTEAELQEERDVVSAILETVGALVIVLDPGGRIVRFNRACERTTGYSFRAVEGQRVWDLFLAPEDRDRFQAGFDQLINGAPPKEEESYWLTRDGDRRLIRWSTTILYGSGHTVRYVIASGTDITERKLLERTILDISGREQRRIGQDLHDGLGQHLTGIAFLSKVQEQRLAERSRPESADAAKIVGLVNDAIHKTRELARGLLPVHSDPVRM
jgi:PAS domain S-box-containing protein